MMYEVLKILEHTYAPQSGGQHFFTRELQVMQVLTLAVRLRIWYWRVPTQLRSLYLTCSWH